MNNGCEKWYYLLVRIMWRIEIHFLSNDFNLEIKFV